MDGFTVTEVVTRAIKYFLEGLAVAIATFIIPQKKLNIEEILAVSIVAAVTFALLDLLAPSIGLTARQGAGFGLGAHLGGFPKLQTSSNLERGSTVAQRLESRRSK